MNKRELLTKTVAGLFCLLLIAFAWVFFNGLALNFESSSGSSNTPLENALFKDLHVGQPVLRRYKGNVVWVTQLASDAEKPSPRLNTYLINANAGCDVNQVYCVLSAATKIDGIHVQYTLQEPSQLPSDTPWFGGFVDPTSGELYDLFGRAYMVNKNKQIQSLPVVKLN